MRDDDNNDEGSSCCLGVFSVFVCSAVTCDQGNPGVVVVFVAVGYWIGNMHAMQHRCCVVAYWMCCCVLDVLVPLLQLVVGKARATNMQCQAPFVELPLNYNLYSEEKYIQKKVQQKYIFVETLTYIDTFTLLQYILSAKHTTSFWFTIFINRWNKTTI